LDVPRAGGPVGGDAGAGGEDGGEALGELLVGDRLGAQVVGLGGQVMSPSRTMTSSPVSVSSR